MKPTLACILVTHNEEKNIEDCLKSVSWADEIVLVDGESTDRTVEIARRYTDKILVKKNAPCETQRLAGIERATGEWILLVDADERVTDELRDEIRGALQSANGVNGFFVIRKNYLNGRPLHLHDPDYQLRLFRRSAEVVLPNRIHDVPKVSGESRKLRGPLVHLFFPSVRDYFTKMNFYTTLEAGYLRDSYGDSLRGPRSLYFVVLKPALRFLQCYFQKNGFRDGFWGFFLSVGSAFYDLQVFAKYWFVRDKLESA